MCRRGRSRRGWNIGRSGNARRVGAPFLPDLIAVTDGFCGRLRNDLKGQGGFVRLPVGRRRRSVIRGGCLWSSDSAIAAN